VKTTAVVSKLRSSINTLLVLSKEPTVSGAIYKPHALFAGYSGLPAFVLPTVALKALGWVPEAPPSFSCISLTSVKPQRPMQTLGMQISIVSVVIGIVRHRIRLLIPSFANLNCLPTGSYFLAEDSSRIPVTGNPDCGLFSPSSSKCLQIIPPLPVKQLTIQVLSGS